MQSSANPIDEGSSNPTKQDEVQPLLNGDPSEAAGQPQEKRSISKASHTSNASNESHHRPLQDLTREEIVRQKESFDKRTPVKLVDDSWQYFALGLSCAALPLVMVAQSSPLSCVRIDETQAKWPNGCMHHAQGMLRLTPFCMKSCMKRQDTVFIVCQGLALCLQILTLMRDTPGCSSWMRVKVLMDGQTECQLAHETVGGLTDNSKRYWSLRKKVNEKVNQTWQSLIRYARGAAAMIIMFELGALVPQTPLTKMSMLFTSLAIIQIGVLLTTSWSPYPVQFHCDGTERLLLSYKNDYVTLCLCVGAAFILMIVLCLLHKAQYTRQIKINNNINSVKEFKKMFFEENGRFVRQDIAEVSNRSLEEWAKDWGKDLKAMQLHLRRLRFVTHGKGRNKKTYDQEEAWKCDSWQGSVILHFGSPEPLSLPWENPHKLLAGGFTFFAAISLFCASQLCWQCVEKIHISDRLTIFEIQQIFNLAGACGRHSPIGTGSLLGSVMLVVSGMMQGILILLTGEKLHHDGSVMKALKKAYNKEMKQRNLWACMTAPNSIILNHQVWEKANIEQPKIWSHVWVKKREKDEQQANKIATGSEKKAKERSKKEEQDGDQEMVEQQDQIHLQEIIPDCDEAEERTWMEDDKLDEERSDKKLDEERSTWYKSKLPIQVQLRRPPEEKRLLRWIRGLFRDEYGPPLLCIVIPKNDFRDLMEQQDFDTLKARLEDAKLPMKCQLVPKQFVAGGVSTWLNLGRKNLWEKLSGALAFGAFFLALYETFYTMISKENMIQTCDDIRNAECTFFDNTLGHPIEFRQSLGFKGALMGGAAALITCFCLRVSYSIDNNSEERGCCQNYMEAVCFHIALLWKLISKPCKLMCQRCCHHDETAKEADISDLNLTPLRQVLLDSNTNGLT